MNVAAEFPSSPVVIVGAGPAGIATALRCRELGLNPIVVERGLPGGILRTSSWPMVSLPGMSGRPGCEVAEGMARDLEREKIPIIEDEVVTLDSEIRGIFLKKRGLVSYKALVIATGIRFRRSGLPGEEEAGEKWFCDQPLLTPKPSGSRGTVIVLGGGENAFSTAIAEAATARRVIVAIRRDAPEIQFSTLAAAVAVPNLTVRTGWRPVRLISNSLPSIEFETYGGLRTVSCERAYAAFGYVPNSEWVEGVLEFTPQRYIAVDAQLRTSVPFVWAVGEIVGPHCPSVAVILGHAPVAAESIAEALSEAKPAAEALRALREREN